MIRRPNEDNENPLDSKCAGPDGVVSIWRGLYPALDFERLIDRWMEIGYYKARVVLVENTDTNGVNPKKITNYKKCYMNKKNENKNNA